MHFVFEKKGFSYCYNNAFQAIFCWMIGGFIVSKLTKSSLWPGVVCLAKWYAGTSKTHMVNISTFYIELIA